MQSLDEIRHAQTQVHTVANYNKYYNGMHDFHHAHDRVWFLSVPKSFFDDAITAGPFEFMVSIGFSFEYVLTNPLFVPFVPGAAYNGDMGTMTFGFGAVRRGPPHDPGSRSDQVHPRAGPGQPAHRAALDRQMDLARLPRADPGGDDDGLHAARAR